MPEESNPSERSSVRRAAGAGGYDDAIRAMSCIHLPKLALLAGAAVSSGAMCLTWPSSFFSSTHAGIRSIAEFDPPGGGTAAPTPRAESNPVADWPVARGDQRLSGFASGSLPDRLTLRWTYDAGKSIASSPVAGGRRVYVGCDDMKLHCIDLATGAPVWTFETGEMIEAPPLVHDGTVYVGSGDFFFYALDAATGSLRWKHETDDKVVGGANWVKVNDETTLIIVGSFDNKLYAFDAATGEVKWTYLTEERINAVPAVAGDRIIFGGCDRYVHEVRATDGAFIRKVFVGDEANMAGAVAVDGSQVYAGHMANEFVRVDLDAERVAWRYQQSRFPFYAAPALAADRVVFAGRDKLVHCVKRESGDVIWTFSTRRKIDGSPVIVGDKVIFGSGDGRLYMVSLADGRELWSYEIGQPVYSSPAVAGGMVIVGANDGRVYAFGAPNAPESGRKAP